MDDTNVIRNQRRFGVALVLSALPAGILAIAGLCLLEGSTALAQGHKGKAQCNAVSLTVSLRGGEKYEKPIGDLTLVMQPLGNNSGWYLELQDEQRSDYIYPVSPPLRFGLRQHIGAGYGDNARMALSYSRKLNFLLNRSDYDHFRPFLEHALWPYSAPKPDRASDEYWAKLALMRKGLVRVNIVKADFESVDVVRAAAFRIELIAPQDFRFDPALKPKRAACPPPTEK